MSKVFKYGILAILIYVAIKEVPPLIDQVSEMGSGLSRKSASVSETQCISTAERASQGFVREMRNYSQPPFDLDSWDLAMEGVREHVYDAQSRCDCGRDSCQRATEALDELNLLIADFDNGLRGDGAPLNPARRQETIDRLLKRARELDRQGR